MIKRIFIALLTVGPVAALPMPYSFEYKIPPIVRAQPKLKAILDAEAAKVRARLAGDTRTGRAEAKANHETFNGSDASIEWSVVAETPRYLSLLNQRSEYTGGAHPNSFTSSLIWDKQARAKRTALSFFASAAALDGSLGAALCTELNKQRRAHGVDMAGIAKDDPSGHCPGVKDGTLMLGSRSKAHFDRIGIIFDPYSAGSYAEGQYEITLPVTPAVIEAVRPVDRNAFAVGH